jgi:hypothetical protein
MPAAGPMWSVAPHPRGPDAPEPGRSGFAVVEVAIDGQWHPCVEVRLVKLKIGGQDANDLKRPGVDKFISLPTIAGSEP